ncbi:MAG: prepilin-type N-terminal cleavage/methylation domain-containing protein [Verrucomicrobiota bacterium]
MNSKIHKTRFRQAGFTLVELAVIIAMMGILAVFLLARLLGDGAGSKADQCKNNHRQLMLAWTMYSDDNNQNLAVNQDPSSQAQLDGVVGKKLAQPSWCAGTLDWTTSAVNTNSIYLVDGRYASIAAYADSNAALYWCPSDVYASTAQQLRGWTHRCRSVAMNAAVGDGAKYIQPWASGGFFVAKRMSDFRYPVPSQAWVFMDEHPDFIDSMLFYSNPSATGVGSEKVPQMPSSCHNGAATVSYADGHVVTHRWTDAQTVRSVNFLHQSNVAVMSDQDLVFLGQATPRAQQ